MNADGPRTVTFSPRRCVLAAFLILVGTSLSAAQESTPLRVGDQAPELIVDEWIRGGPESIDGGQGGALLIEFWATWSPVCRLVLSSQDSLLAAGGAEGLEIVAVSQEDADSLRQFVEAAGWRHLNVACDRSRRAMQTFLRAYAATGILEPEFPFAFIIGSGLDRERGAVLWAGPLSDPQADVPLAAFQAALEQVTSGTYDLEPSVESARQQERSVTLFQELSAARRSGDLGRIEELLEESTRIEIARGFANTLFNNMNGLAWGLVTGEDPTEQHFRIAFRAIEIGLAAGGGEDPYFVDTQARVLYEAGRLDEALETQRRALMLAQGGPAWDTCAVTLRSYLQEAGLPEDDAILVELKPEADPEVSIWRGSLNQVSQQYDRSTDGILVRPNTGEDPERDAAWTDELDWLIDCFFQGSPVRLAEQVTAQERRSKVLTLYGTPRQNPLTAEILSFYDIEIGSNGVDVGGVLLETQAPTLIVCVPNPWDPTLPVSIYTASREEDAHSLNSFFHGPTSLMLGHWVDGEPEVVQAIDLEATVTGEGSVSVGFRVGPPTLSAEMAAQDLKQLHTLLAENYAGYPDLAWELKLAGSSWGEHTETFLSRIAEREQWSADDYFTLLQGYLTRVADAHFAMRGRFEVEGRIVERDAGFICHSVPFFTELQIWGDRVGYRVIEVPAHLSEYVGAELVDVSPVGTSHTVEHEVPYLFPTLSSHPIGVGEEAPPEYLLGVFADRDQPPDSITVSVGPMHPESAPGVAAREYRQVRFALHRGRSALSDWTVKHWDLADKTEEQPPVLSVRTMAERRLGGLAETADGLRSEPCLVLDLRGNPGGSDGPAWSWCSRCSGQTYESAGAVAPWPSDTYQEYRWIAMPGRQQTPSSEVSASRPYEGTLYVLTDAGVASSGETFRLLAAQIPGAITLGENTAGCAAYGNVQTHDPLENSRIQFAFGRSRFVQDWVEPNREGVGLFPDYWLDTEDPVGYISEYARGCGGR